MAEENFSSNKSVPIDLLSQNSEPSSGRIVGKPDAAVAIAKRRASIFGADRRKYSSFKSPLNDLDPELLKWLQAKVRARISSTTAEDRLKACLSNEKYM